MSSFRAALWAETLKARRSLILPITACGILILPAIDGLFMFILADPERARAMGLIGMKAQLAAGSADWPTFADILSQGGAIGGAFLFALVVAWVFGREFSDRTLPDLLALPVRRGQIVAAKFVVVALWVLFLALEVAVVGLTVGIAVGRAVPIPGWSGALGWSLVANVMLTALLNALLLPPVAWVASAGRGYLMPVGWAFLTIVLAQVAAFMGWGDWFPWAVPAVFSGAAGDAGPQPAIHSYLVVLLVAAIGTAATVTWWNRADHAQ